MPSGFISLLRRQYWSVCWQLRRLKPEACEDFITQKSHHAARQLLHTSKWQKVMLRWRLPLRYWDRLPVLCLSSETSPPRPCLCWRASSQLPGHVHEAQSGLITVYTWRSQLLWETSKMWMWVKYQPAMISRSGRLVPREELRAFEDQAPLMLKIRPLQTINRHLMLSVVQSEHLSLYLLIITVIWDDWRVD